MGHDPLCVNYIEGVWFDSCICKTCDLIAKVRQDERTRIVFGVREWCLSDPIISRADPKNIWGYAYGVQYTMRRIEAGDFADSVLDK